jgi:chromate reductase
MSDHTLLGICGSLRAGSFNRKLMLEAARLYAPATFIDGNLRLPLYDGDLEEQGLPEEVATLAEQVRSADAVVVVTPEYNKMIPGVLKNALDWLSRVKGGVWTDKPVAIMSATAGRTGGEVSLFTLRHAMAPFRPRLHLAPATMVAGSSEEFDENGRLKNERYVTGLTEQMQALKASV